MTTVMASSDRERERIRPRIGRKIGRGFADVGPPSPGARRCIIKGRVVPMVGRGIAAAKLHLDYIQREGVEQDGSKGDLYGGEPASPAAAMAAPIAKEKHQFRFIVSPEDVDHDLRLFARSLMAQVEVDLGRQLI